MKRGVIFLLALLAVISTVYAFCGDGLVDSDGSETCKTCPQDNPCFVDQRCIQGQCINKLLPPLFLREDPTATIIIPETISETLHSLFQQPYEFAACLKGKYSDGVYQITDIDLPEISAQGVFAVEHAKCRGFGVIATIHSHLDGNCALSQGDLFSFGQKEEPLSAIMCGENDIAFYSKKSFTNRMNYVVRDVGNTRLNYFWTLFPWVFSILLIIILLVLFYERERLHNLRKKDIALGLIEKFTPSKNKVVNTLLLHEKLPKEKVSSRVLQNLVKNKIVEEKDKEIHLKHWFKKALKKL